MRRTRPRNSSTQATPSSVPAMVIAKIGPETIAR
ncbi:Uncharacterised protein [Mycobacteroides abscessus subsp. abscessus]|nr:Uncharacterised protein [Mycobacteroides abscessus subsp. abscessus]